MVFIDVDLREERLVEQSPGTFVSFEVGGLVVACQVKRVSENSSNFLEIGFGGGELFLNATELGRDAILLGLEHIDRDGVGVVCGEQLLALSFQLCALLTKLLTFGLGDFV